MYACVGVSSDSIQIVKLSVSRRSGYYSDFLAVCVYLTNSIFFFLFLPFLSFAAEASKPRSLQSLYTTLGCTLRNQAKTKQKNTRTHASALNNNMHQCQCHTEDF